MIKNAMQAKRLAAKIQYILNKIQQLESQDSSIELACGAEQPRDEVVKMQKELNDFNLLSSLSLEDAVEGPLQEPVRLENIGRHLINLRIASKLSQAEMAQKLGWPQSDLSRFESDHYSSQSIKKF